MPIFFNGVIGMFFYWGVFFYNWPTSVHVVIVQLHQGNIELFSLGGIIGHDISFHLVKELHVAKMIVNYKGY